MYQAEGAFWEANGGRGWYDALRAKYRASALPSVYDKVHVRLADRRRQQSRFAWLRGYWPIGGAVSAWVSYASKDQALHQKATWRWTGEGG